MLGGILALLSAAAFALNNAAARRGVLSGSVLQAMSISVPFGVPFFFAGVLIFGSLDDLAAFSGREIGWFAAAGILHFILGRYANYRGAKAIGAVMMGPIQDLNILVSLILAVIFLGETITPLMAIGIVLVVFGPALVFESKAKREEAAKRASSKKAPPHSARPIRKVSFSQRFPASLTEQARFSCESGSKGRPTSAGALRRASSPTSLRHWWWAHSFSCPAATAMCALCAPTRRCGSPSPAYSSGLRR